MRRALLGLAVCPRRILVDGNRLPRLMDLAPRLRGRAPSSRATAREPAISAASILAKTHRDAVMEQLDVVYPGYGMAVHKGYGTADHLAALVRLAACAIHRRSFGPGNRTAANRTGRIRGHMKHAFVHLRLHTEFSLVDSIVRVPELLAATLSAGMPAVASPTRTISSRW